MKVIASNQPGYRGEHYLLGPGSLVGRRWTPNALSYDVVTPVANVVVINQNYDTNWRLARGRGEVFSQGGLIAVRVPAGGQHLRLVYRSNAFLVGAAISLLTAVITLALWIASCDPLSLLSSIFSLLCKRKSKPNAHVSWHCPLWL